MIFPFFFLLYYVLVIVCGKVIADVLLLLLCCLSAFTILPLSVVCSPPNIFMAVTFGKLHFTMPLQTPRIVSLLSESYNPHVRYGAALAVGISCAGTGLSEAISLLEPLTSDVVDFVRQGALIAMAMVMVQMNEASDSRVGTFRYCVIVMFVMLFFT